MAIIISKNGKDAERVEESAFALEDDLQNYISKNPDVIPIYEIDEDINLFVAAREFPTNSGPIDALAFDVNGNIYVVETKLYRNQDKRKVVAQVLDYGASLWRHSTDFESFINQLDNRSAINFNQKFTEKIVEFFGLDDSESILENIKFNLSEGVIKYVVLMDKVHDALKDLIIYINQNSKFDIYGVELEYYKHEQFEIIIPKLYGGEVKKDISVKKNQNEDKWLLSDEDSFLSSVENKFESDVINEQGKETIYKLASLLKEVAKKSQSRAEYYQANTSQREVQKLVLIDLNEHYTINLDSDGWLKVFVGKKQGPLIDFLKELLKLLIDKQLYERNARHLEASQWFINLGAEKYTDDNRAQFIKASETAFKKVFGFSEK